MQFPDFCFLWFPDRTAKLHNCPDRKKIPQNYEINTYHAYFADRFFRILFFYLPKFN